MYDLERFYFLPKALEIPFECTYPNQAAASLLEMNIKESGLILLAPDHGSGAFDLDMSIYKVLKLNVWEDFRFTYQKKDLDFRQCKQMSLRLYFTLLL